MLCADKILYKQYKGIHPSVSSKDNLNTLLFPGTYILHVSRETLSCGGDRTLHLPQEVLLCLWTAHILLCHKVSKTPAGSKDITEKLKNVLKHFSLQLFNKRF